jgi:hypothetical protein
MQSHAIHKRAFFTGLAQSPTESRERSNQSVTSNKLLSQDLIEEPGKQGKTAVLSKG